MLVSKRFADYPRKGYQMTGTYMQDENRVISCGGYLCDGDVVSFETCRTEKLCFTTSPQNPSFTRDGDLVRGRQNHKMVNVENVYDLLSNDPVPMVFGGMHSMSEIYNPRSGSWSEYRLVPDRNWFGVDCVVHFDDSIWRVRRDISELHPISFEFTNYGQIPPPLANPGKCAGIDVDGAKAILFIKGYYIDLETRNTTKVAYPPWEAIDGPLPNNMFTFRGKPTVFGFTRCDEEGNCEDDRVLQYDPKADEWRFIGNILGERRDVEVVEVPRSWCNMAK